MIERILKMTENEISENLQAAGCTQAKGMLDSFAMCDTEEKLRLLEKQRFRILQNLHKYERRIDCLDYLMHRLRCGE